MSIRPVPGRRSTRTAGLILVFLLLVAACSSGDDDSGSEGTGGDAPATNDGPSGEIVVAAPPPISELALPHLGQQANSIIWDLFNDYLLVADPEAGELGPSLATEWEESEDELSWTFHLRDDVTFHGDWGKLTSADVKYTLDRRAENVSDGELFSERIVSVDAPDELTVVVNLNAPWPDFGYVMSDASIRSSPIISKAYVEEVGDDAAAQEPVGSGPFEFVEKQEGSSITARAFADYWGDPPGVEQVTLRWVPDESTRFAQLQSGEAQVAVLSRRLAQSAEQDGYKEWLGSVPTSVWLVLGGQYLEDREGYDADLPWLDAQVREALNLAIDRDAIVDSIFVGQAEPLAVPLCRDGFPGWTDDIQPYDYDPAQAEDLLADAGYPDGFSVTLRSYVMSGVPEMPDMVSAVAEYWRRIGLDVNVESIEFDQHRSEYLARKVSGIAFGMRNAPATPADLLDQFRSQWTSEGAIGGLELPDLDAEVLAAEQTGDPGERETAYTDICSRISEENRAVPIASVNAVYVTSQDVAEWTIDASSALDIHTLRLAG